MIDNEMNNVPEVGLKLGTVEGQSGSTAAGVGGDGDVGTTITTESGVKCHCCPLQVSDVSVLQCLWFLVSVLHCWIHHVEEKVQTLILRCLRWFLSAPAADEISVRDSNFGSEQINVCLCGEVIKDEGAAMLDENVTEVKVRMENRFDRFVFCPVVEMQSDSEALNVDVCVSRSYVHVVSRKFESVTSSSFIKYCRYLTF